MVPAGNKATPFIGQPCKKKKQKKTPSSIHPHRFTSSFIFTIFNFFLLFYAMGPNFLLKVAFSCYKPILFLF